MTDTEYRAHQEERSARERRTEEGFHQEVVARVAELIREPLGSTGNRRRDDLIARLTAAGAFRLTADGEPGSEVRADAVVQVTLLVARLSPSIAQVVQTHYSALAALARYVHVDGPRPASLPAGRYVQLQSEPTGPTGSFVGSTIRRTPDGLRLHGVKDYVTGIEWAEWLNTGALYDGRKVQVILPRSAAGVSVKPTWAAFGQRDTESNRVELNGVPVDEKSIFVPDGTPQSPITKLAHAAIDIGIGEAAMDAFRSFLLHEARVRNSAAGAGVETVPDDPYIRRQFGLGSAELSALRARLFEFTAIMSGARQSGGPDRDIDLDVRIRAFAAYAGEAAVRLTSELFSNSGGRAAELDRELDSYWRDARVHTLLNPRDWSLSELGRNILENSEREVSR